MLCWVPELCFPGTRNRSMVRPKFSEKNQEKFMGPSVCSTCFFGLHLHPGNLT